MQLSLEKQIALVTGANGGLGVHFAATLAKAGATVVLGARRPEAADAVCRQINEAGGRATVVELDVTEQSSVQRALDHIESQLGPLNVLVNNAGIAVTKPVLEHTERDWQDVLSVNLTGAWYTAQETVRRMVRAETGGSIVNVASILGLRVAAQIPAYVASKAALIQLSKAMALELARHRIRVNALAPGYIKTELNDAFFATEAGAAIIKRIPQRRLGRLEDLDGALLLLASEAGAYITGSVLSVDGGHLASSL
ncbi:MULTISPECIES: SDR family NAD(P)-dependent oxidoreductase [Paraburkholderia]|jgi:NAD(P)-dependent dehydrogenase (short-subunit alcohol dehydrogenase family)|uniref:SDR family NAD(P)-dependent oxidoreductase n=1 Tax=Paraburkholderia TaxID=1822464 RepID=UPI0038BDE60C